MSRTTGNRRVRPKAVLATILILGFASAIGIYVTAVPTPGNPLGYEPEDSRQYLREMELYGGKANVLAADLRQWFHGLWHGRTLAFTVVVITIVVAFGLRFFLDRRPADPAGELGRRPAAADEARGIAHLGRRSARPEKAGRNEELSGAAPGESPGERRMSGSVSNVLRQGERARREGRLDDAFRDFSQAVELSRASGARRDLVAALKGLGQIERGLGRGDAARPLYEEAVAICREEGDALALAHTVRHLGDIHRAAGRVELAEPCYREALALYRGDERTAPLDLANAIRALAILETDAGKTEEARRLWREARDLYAAAGVRDGVAESSARLEGLPG